MRYRFLTKFIFILACMSFATAFANTNTGCTPLTSKAQDKNIILPGPEDKHASSVYFFKNISSQGIWIDHPVPHPSASAGWSSYVRAGNASALLVNRKNFTISCAVIKPGKVDYLDCGKVITVCAANNVTVSPSNRKGTYWLSEDKSWADVVTALKKRGVVVQIY